MSYSKLSIATLILTLISGCSHQAVNSAKLTAKNQATESVTLLNYELSNTALRFNTIGFGCTFYNNYQVVANKSENSIEVIELVSDNCQMKPRSVALSYSIQHLDLDFAAPLVIKNPIKNPVKNHNTERMVSL